eukprot:COSAG01_NODE_10129_length_2241_cov_11.869342_4_plen_81_part_01
MLGHWARRRRRPHRRGHPRGKHLPVWGRAITTATTTTAQVMPPPPWHRLTDRGWARWWQPQRARGLTIGGGLIVNLPTMQL